VSGELQKRLEQLRQTHESGLLDSVYAAACRNLPLRGVDVGESDPITEEQLRYIRDGGEFQMSELPAGDRVVRGLHLPKSEGDLSSKELAPLPVLTAVAAKRKTVLLGDPGSGKSTFLNFLGFCLARQGLEPMEGWLDKLPGWPKAEADLLPISITLRDYARSIKSGDKPTPNLVKDELT